MEVRLCSSAVCPVLLQKYLTSSNTSGTVGREAASLCHGRNIHGQLMAGSRWFDIRPVIGNGGQLLTGHYSGQKAPVFGINGQALADIVDDVNRFTAANPELVVLSLSHGRFPYLLRMRQARGSPAD